MGKITVIYHAPPGDDRVVDMRGVTFFDGQPVEIDTEEHTALANKLRTNWHFEVSGGEAPIDGLPASDQEPDAEGLVAVHRGRGSWSIMKGDAEVIQGIDKAEAEAFNALSDDDKAAYVEAYKPATE